MKIHELVEAAFLAGYRHALDNNAFWKGSRRFVGPGKDYSLAVRQAPEKCKEAYALFLQAAQTRHDGVAKPIELEGEQDGA